jgi:hypothetical protein
MPGISSPVSRAYARIKSKEPKNVQGVLMLRINQINAALPAMSKAIITRYASSSWSPNIEGRFVRRSVTNVEYFAEYSSNNHAVNP